MNTPNENKITPDVEASLDSLVIDLQLEIISYLSAVDIKHLFDTCKRLKKLETKTSFLKMMAEVFGDNFVYQENQTTPQISEKFLKNLRVLLQDSQLNFHSIMELFIFLEKNVMQALKKELVSPGKGVLFGQNIFSVIISLDFWKLITPRLMTSYFKLNFTLKDIVAQAVENESYAVLRQCLYFYDDYQDQSLFNGLAVATLDSELAKIIIEYRQGKVASCAAVRSRENNLTQQVSLYPLIDAVVTGNNQEVVKLLDQRRNPEDKHAFLSNKPKFLDVECNALELAVTRKDLGLTKILLAHYKAAGLFASKDAERVITVAIKNRDKNLLGYLLSECDDFDQCKLLLNLKNIIISNEYFDPACFNLINDILYKGSSNYENILSMELLHSWPALESMLDFINAVSILCKYVSRDQPEDREYPCSEQDEKLSSLMIAIMQGENDFSTRKNSNVNHCVFLQDASLELAGVKTQELSTIQVAVAVGNIAAVKWLLGFKHLAVQPSLLHLAFNSELETKVKLTLIELLMRDSRIVETLSPKAGGKDNVVFMNARGPVRSYWKDLIEKIVATKDIVLINAVLKKCVPEKVKSNLAAVALMKAIRLNHLEIVNNLISQVSMDIWENGFIWECLVETMLVNRDNHRCPSDFAIFKRFAQLPKNINQKYYDGKDLLYRAVASKRSDMADFLLKRGANPNQRYPGVYPFTLLTMALQGEDFVTAKMLIQHGAEICPSDQKAETHPLWMLVEKKCVDLLDLAFAMPNFVTRKLPFDATDSHILTQAVLKKWPPHYLAQLANKFSLNLNHQGGLNATLLLMLVPCLKPGRQDKEYVNEVIHWFIKNGGNPFIGLDNHSSSISHLVKNGYELDLSILNTKFCNTKEVKKLIENFISLYGEFKDNPTIITSLKTILRSSDLQKQFIPKDQSGIFDLLYVILFDEKHAWGGMLLFAENPSLNPYHVLELFLNKDNSVILGLLKVLQRCQNIKDFIPNKNILRFIDETAQSLKQNPVGPITEMESIAHELKAKWIPQKKGFFSHFFPNSFSPSTTPPSDHSSTKGFNS